METESGLKTLALISCNYKVQLSRLFVRHTLRKEVPEAVHTLDTNIVLWLNLFIAVCMCIHGRMHRAVWFVLEAGLWTAATLQC